MYRLMLFYNYWLVFIGIYRKTLLIFFYVVHSFGMGWDVAQVYGGNVFSALH